jgi:pyridinium-3,5-bisthiocarboxylic acid mononucleotide nickel chelatase
VHIHLDPVGGIAGDMFTAALLDAWPELGEGAMAAVRAAGLGDEVRLAHLRHHDGTLTGSRFAVDRQAAAPGHDHVHWRRLRERLLASALVPEVAARAVAIFSLLAEAEAAVHGHAVEDVTFHEVGAFDSIADIVAAAHLIEALGAKGWSIGPLPLGSGRVRAAHGELPVPAPATVRLLEGFACFDDGRPGERVTPTGAAILRHLAPAQGLGRAPRRLQRAGYGFGTKRFEGISNVLRVLAFAPVEAPGEGAVEQVAVVRFEVDDQAPEDLAIGLDNLRAQDGVLDVLQAPAVGKKGRLVVAVQLLVRPERLDEVTAACFSETTTLGLRWTIEARRVLARREVSKGGVRVKLATRPGGVISAKAESDDLRAGAGLAGRRHRRLAAEHAALEEDENG